MADPFSAGAVDTTPAATAPQGSLEAVGQNLSNTVQNPDFYRNLTAFGANTMAAANARTPQGFLANGSGWTGAVGQGILGAQQGSLVNAEAGSKLRLQNAQTANLGAEAQSHQMANRRLQQQIDLSNRIYQAASEPLDPSIAGGQSSSNNGGGGGGGGQSAGIGPDTTSQVPSDGHGVVPAAQRYALLDHAITSQHLVVPHRFGDALAQGESSWQVNPDTGSAGDTGQLQITPGTAQQPGIPGVTPTPITALAGPQNRQANIDFGMNLLDKIGRQHGLNTSEDWENNKQAVAATFARYNGYSGANPLDSPYVQQMGYRLARAPSYAGYEPQAPTQEANAASTNGAPQTANDASPTMPGTDTPPPGDTSGGAPTLMRPGGDTGMPGAPQRSAQPTPMPPGVPAFAQTGGMPAPQQSSKPQQFTPHAAMQMAGLWAQGAFNPTQEQARAMAPFVGQLVANGTVNQDNYKKLLDTGYNGLVAGNEANAKLPATIAAQQSQSGLDTQRDLDIARGKLPLTEAGDAYKNQLDMALSDRNNQNETARMAYLQRIKPDEWRSGGGLVMKDENGNPIYTLAAPDTRDAVKDGVPSFASIARTPTIAPVPGAAPPTPFTKPTFNNPIPPAPPTLMSPPATGAAPPPPQQPQPQPQMPRPSAPAPTPAPQPAPDSMPTPAPMPNAAPPQQGGAAPDGGRLRYRVNPNISGQPTQLPQGPAPSAAPPMPLTGAAPGATPTTPPVAPTAAPQTNISVSGARPGNSAEIISLDNGQPLQRGMSPEETGRRDALKAQAEKLLPTLQAQSEAAFTQNNQYQHYADLMDQANPGSGAEWLAGVKGVVGSALNHVGFSSQALNQQAGTIQAMKASVAEGIRNNLREFKGRSNTEYHATSEAMAATPDNTRYGNKIFIAQAQGMNDYDIAMHQAYLKAFPNPGVSTGTLPDGTPTNIQSFTNDFQNSYSPTTFIANRMAQSPEGATFLRNMHNTDPTTNATSVMGPDGKTPLTEAQLLGKDVKRIQQQFGGIGGIPNANKPIPMNPTTKVPVLPANSQDPFDVEVSTQRPR